MLIAFGMEAVAMTLWLMLRHDPLLFVLLSGVVFLGWGEIFSLFPSTLTDTFGSKHAIVNYACLSYAQGVGSILGGPVAALLHQRTGGWDAVFGTALSRWIVVPLCSRSPYSSQCATRGFPAHPGARNAIGNGQLARNLAHSNLRGCCTASSILCFLVSSIFH